RARGAPGALVVGADRLQGGRRLVEGREAEDPLTAVQARIRPGVLDDGGAPAGQVAQRAVADPGVLEADARPLRAAELAARRADVVAVGVGRAGDVEGVAHAPAFPDH